MKMKFLLLSSVVVASTMFAADDLAKLAKDSGLVALPKSPAEIAKLAEASAPDAKEFPTTEKRVELGKKLYFDPRISRSGIISCNTCHNLAIGGTDGVPASYKCTYNTKLSI